MRTCCICKEPLDETLFSRYKYTTTGGNRSIRYDSVCKKCRRLRRVEHKKKPGVREKCNQYSRQWREKNIIWVNTYSLLYRSSERGREVKAYCQASRSARQRSTIRAAGYDHEKVLTIYKEAKATTKGLQSCVSSDDPLELVMHVDHIIPISKGGAHHQDNLRIISARENLEKGAKIV